MMDSPRLARTVSRVLKALGMDAISCEDLKAAEAAIGEARPDLLVYDIESETLETRRFLKQMSMQETAPSLILLSEGGDVPMLRDLLNYPSGYNLVHKDGLLDNGDLLITARKLVDRDIFGVDKYLRWGSVIHTCQAASSPEKNDIITKLEGFLEDLDCEPRYISDIANAMDEFITNAFFHAPAEDGVSLHSHLPRTQVIALPAWTRPTIEFGCDGRMVGIACRDPFGSLDTKSLLEHLASCAELARAEVNEGPGGAGIGLYATYRTLDHLIINLEAGVATELVALVDVTIPYGQHVKLPRKLNVFALEPFAD
jgi:hypothetical protein